MAIIIIKCLLGVVAGLVYGLGHGLLQIEWKEAKISQDSYRHSILFYHLPNQMTKKILVVWFALREGGLVAF